MRRVTAKAPGKAILFGEHAVVYEYPAIAMAISKQSECNVQSNLRSIIEIELVDYKKTYEFLDYIDLIRNFPEDIQAISKGIMRLHKNYDIDPQGVRISINSDIIPHSGLGSSASTAVAMIGAVSGYYEKKLSKEEISEIAYEMELITHGSPSGIDNTTCTFGNLIYFNKGQIEFLKVKNNFNFLITYTNIPHNTKHVINQIKELKDTKSKLVKSVFKDIAKISEAGKQELIKGKVEKVGSLMNKNQELLSKLEISNKVINEIVETSLNNGALGSKLTGAGLGGCVLSLVKEEDLQLLSKILFNKGFNSFICKTDNEGVKIEGIW